ncbi:hypothetical protein MBLNU230_g7634t1 [Neophaeotheca triangularis]
MAAQWKGQFVLDASQPAHGIRINTPATPLLLPDSASLSFLSIVETSRIPLQLIISADCNVTTPSPELAAWFSSVLLSPDDEQPGLNWWENAKPDSRLGILASIDHKGAAVRSGAKPTEVLFYASRGFGGNHPLTPPDSSANEENGDGATEQSGELSVHATVLSSELLVQLEETSLPSSSGHLLDDDTEAIFLNPRYQEEHETIHEPPVKKRKSVNDAFDEANERRRKAKRHGGESVAAAAAAKPEPNLPSLKHRRSVSGAGTVPIQTRPHSRSPSISSSRPTTARQPSEALKRSSTLSRMQSTAGLPEETTTEDKNKETISRVVMAGMRLFGLSQSKSRKSTTGGASPVVDTSAESAEATRAKDEEYKLVYHQVYKGVCFAFRQHIASKSLQLFSEALRDTADKLLTLYCNDPIGEGLASAEAKITPGGRKAFGSEIQGELSAFDEAAEAFDAKMAGKRPKRDRWDYGGAGPLRLTDIEYATTSYKAVHGEDAVEPGGSG